MASTDAETPTATAGAGTHDAAPEAAVLKAPPSPFARLRSKMTSEVARGTALVLRLQTLRSNALAHVWLRGASALGDQWSYMVILPAFFWTGDARLGCEFTILLLLGTFLGNFAKNLFALPRPPSPPVRYLQHAMRDFGFPSVHTLNAITVSGMLLKYHWEHAWFYFTEDVVLAQYVFAGGVALAIFWSISIPLSRMYVGVHSPLDCAGGATAGFVFLATWLAVYPSVEHWITESRTLLVPIMITFGILATAMHPRSHRPSPSFRNNIAVIGIIVGTVIGVAYHPYLDAQLLQYVKDHNIVLPIVPVRGIADAFGIARSQAVSVLRFVIGIVTVLLVKFITEPLLRVVFSALFVLPWLSAIKARIVALFDVIVVPHPEAYNNVDFPVASFAKEVEDYQRQLAEEAGSSKRLAQREAGVLSRLVAHSLVGIVIVNWVRVLFSQIGLGY